MTRNTWCVKLAAFLAAVALMLSASFAFMNTSARAEEETALQAAEEAVPAMVEEETAQQEAEEAVPVVAEPEEEIAPQTVEEAAPAVTEPEEEIAPQTVEEAAPQVTEPEEETVPEIKSEPEPVAEPEDHQEDAQPEAADDEWMDDDEETVDPEEDEELAIIEDDDAGTVSEEILEPFNNPELYEQEAFVGTAEIRLMNEGMLSYGDEIILKADVRDVNVSYRLVWEANDGHDWFTVGSGEEYRFILARENAAREYRVEIFAVD